MVSEKRKFIHSLIFPSLFVVLLWLVKIIEYAMEADFAFLGLYPLSLRGLIGIITAPFIHGDFSHLFANTSSLFVLGIMLFYFYRSIAYRVFFFTWLLTGIWVWLLGRESYHIGASGLVYGLAAFLFASGIIRKNQRLLAITLVVVFLYGSMVWGIFPKFFPRKNISWESHMMGMLAGVVLAVFYRKHGPQRKKYSWEYEEEEEDDDDDDESAYWKIDDKNFRP